VDTPTSAADLKALRRALGYEQWNLLGVSYGARLALEMLRVDPKGTRAAIIDSAYVPGNGGLARSLDLARDARARLVAACEDDTVCSASHPDLAGEIDALVAQADDDPIETSVTLEDGTVVPLAITGTDIAGALFNAQYDEGLIPLLPSIVTALSEGDTSIVPEIGRQAIPFVNSVAEGAYAAVDCADNGPIDTAAADARALRRAGKDALVVALNPDCRHWDVPPVRDSFVRLPRSRVPMLALAGSLDPITPPDDTRAAADAARGPSTFVEFEGNGHGNWNSNDCARSIVRAFLADPTTEPDTSCTEGLTFAFAG
jgi:pimeloyl-ACP methyl ester carboxylesterase